MTAAGVPAVHEAWQAFAQQRLYQPFRPNVLQCALAQSPAMCYCIAVGDRLLCSWLPSQAAGARRVTGDLESGEPAQAPAAAANPPVPAASGHGVGSIACPVRALLVVLASAVCACVGVWLILDDKHVTLTPSCAPGARA